MNIFFVEQPNQKKSQEVLLTLRQALKECIPQAETDPVFSLAYDGEDQFFLKRRGEIVWGRVFYQTLSDAALSGIPEEIKKLSNTFKQTIRPHLFFPEERVKDQTLFSKVSGRPHFFKYDLLQSEIEKAISVREYFPLPEPKVSLVEEVKKPLPFNGYTFFKYARLTPQELSDLIDLSLEIRR